jgi:hypothetical protein
MGFGTPGAASTQVFYVHPTDLAIDASPRVLPERIEVGAELGHDRLWLQAAVPARSPARRLSGGVQPLEPRTSASRGFGGFALSSRHGGQMAWKAVPDPEPDKSAARSWSRSVSGPCATAATWCSSWPRWRCRARCWPTSCAGLSGSGRVRGHSWREHREQYTDGHPTGEVRRVIDRGPLKREACSGRGTRSRLSEASPGGPGRRTLASCGEPTHDRRSGTGIWEMSGESASVDRHDSLTTPRASPSLRFPLPSDALYLWHGSGVFFHSGSIGR